MVASIIAIIVYRWLVVFSCYNCLHMVASIIAIIVYRWLVVLLL